MSKQTFRPDLLELCTQSKSGKFSKRSVVGSAYLTVTKGYNEPYNQIAIDVYEGYQQERRQLETALITVTFSDKSTWSGSFPELQTLLTMLPNGFDNWHETHYEIVTHLAAGLEVEGSRVSEIRELVGIGGMYELAESLTNQFEQLHKGRQWDGEYFDEVENFMATWAAGNEPLDKSNTALPFVYSLTDHILGMENDAYLSGHPEWNEIVEHAKRTRKSTK